MLLALGPSPCLALLGALLLTGCPTAGVVADAPVIRSWLPPQAVGLPRSYVTPNANGTQSGRVAVVPKPLSGLTQVADLTAVRSVEGVVIDPVSLLLPEAADVLVLDYGPGHSFEIRQRSGQRIPLQRNSWTTIPRGAASLALGRGVIIGSDLVRYTGTPGPLSRVTSSRPLASLAIKGLLLTVDLTAPLPAGAGSEDVPWMIHAGLRREADQIWQELWYFTIGGPNAIGCAAIDPSGQVAIATKDGRFVVIGPEGTTDGRPSGKVRRQIASSPYYLSAIGGSWIMVEPRRPPLLSPRLTGLETFEDLVERARLFEEERSLIYGLYVDPPSSKISWKTGIVALDGAGNESWSTEVPFRVLSPPIDGGNNLVFVVGEGLAAIERGELRWSQSGAGRMLATAFEDGTLAVVDGRELRITGRDGGVRQVFHTPEEEPITAPPAIAADGSVWLATRKGVYVVR